MKCCASPTISTAADRVVPVVSQTVEALVFGEVLKPLAAALGPMGDQLVEIVAERVFVPRSR